MMPHFLALLDGAQIALFAIDEAHCVSAMGARFPAGISCSSRDCGRAFPRRAAHRADRHRGPADARGHPRSAQARRTRDCSSASFDRPNIRYSIAQKDEPQRQLLRFSARIRARAASSIACRARRSRKPPSGLPAQGINALPYHAGLDADVRARNQERFLQEDGLVHGGDDRVRHGHRQAGRPLRRASGPARAAIEAYYQETGRAGRDGAAGRGLLLYGLQDVVLRRQMIDEGEAPRRGESGSSATSWTRCWACARRRAAAARRCSRYFGEAMPAPCGNCDTCLDAGRNLGRHRRGAEGDFRRPADRPAFRRRPSGRRAAGRQEREDPSASAMRSCRRSASARSSTARSGARCSDN